MKNIALFCSLIMIGFTSCKKENTQENDNCGVVTSSRGDLVTNIYTLTNSYEWYFTVKYPSGASIQTHKTTAGTTDAYSVGKSYCK